jgi:integrase
VATIEDLWLAPDGSRRPRDGKGMRYRVRWTLPGGAERSRSFPSGKKTLAQNFKTKVEADLLRGTYTDPRAGRITLREYVTSEWLPQQKKAGPLTREATERRWRLHIEPQLGDKMLAAITVSAVRGWLAGLDAAPGTVRVLMALLSSILASAAEDGRIVSNPMHARSVKGPAPDKRKVVPWAGEQVAAARAAMPARWAAMVDVGAGLGLRIGEVRGLAVADIDFLRRRVHVRRQVQRVGGRLVLAPPKGGKERHVPLPDSVAVALAEHIRQFPPREVALPWRVPSGKPVTAALLFAMPSGRPVEPNSWNATAWHRAVEAAGLAPGRDNGFHVLRHTYASLLLAGGVDVRTVSEALGHHDPGFTLRTYAHLMPDAGEKIRAAIDHGAAVASPAQETGTGHDLH